jgi:hypothetical protein
MQLCPGCVRVAGYARLPKAHHSNTPANIHAELSLQTQPLTLDSRRSHASLFSLSGPFVPSAFDN